MTARIWTLANWIMLLMFIFSAAVQFNDPDPLVWVGIYAAAAVVCGLEIRRRTPVWAPLTVAIIALVWAASLYSRGSEVPVSSLFSAWEMRNVHIEEAREMYGLAIVGVWMVVMGIVRWAWQGRSVR